MSNSGRFLDQPSLIRPRTASGVAPDHSGRFATAGQGIVDFPDFVARLKAVGFDGPLVTHGLSAAEAPHVAAFLKELV